MKEKHPLLVLAAVLIVQNVWVVGDAWAESDRSPGEKAQQSVCVLVAYYSRSGNTERMAEAVAKGSSRVPGVKTVIKKVEEVTKDDLNAADGIVLGSPTYFANLPGKMKMAIDDWSWKMKADLTDKVGGAFATGGGQMGGKEHVVVSLLLFMINNRMVVGGPLYSDAEDDDKWAELGAGALTGPIDWGVGEVELDSAHRIGERVARLSRKMAGS